MEAKFEAIYANNTWGQGSGEGSYAVHTLGYVAFLQRFLAKHSIRTVLDFGCGDWQFSQSIDWGDVHYVGVDIVESVIKANQRRFGAANIEFRLRTTDEPLPDADLLITKDVLQHWSNAKVQAFLPQLYRYRYALVTNCVNPRGPTVNGDIQDGDFRYLDLRLTPFNLNAKPVYSFANSRVLPLFRRPIWRKQVLLVRRDTQI
jgi:SAM-dependent methyltransferase